MIKINILDKVKANLKALEKGYKSIPTKYINSLSFTGFGITFIVMPVILVSCTNALVSKYSNLEILAKERLELFNEAHPSAEYRILEGSCTNLTTKDIECNLIKKIKATGIEFNDYKLLCTSDNLHTDSQDMVCDIFRNDYSPVNLEASIEF